MDNEITGVLENWHVVGNVVYGDVYGDVKLRFFDGTPIKTSAIRTIGVTEVTTRNSVYKLGKPLSL